MGRSVREILSRELTFRLGINKEKEPTVGRTEAAFQAVGRTYAKALK